MAGAIDPAAPRRRGVPGVGSGVAVKTLRSRIRPAPPTVLVYAFVVVMLGTTMPTPMYSLYAQSLHFSVLMTTVVFAGYAVGVLAALIGFGAWSDALGRRPMLLAGVLLAGASSVAFLTAGPVGQLLLGRLLSGLSAGIFTGTATAAIVEAAPPHRRAKAAVIATIANMGGLGLGPLLGGLLVQYLRWPLHLAFTCHLALLVVAGIALMLIPETSVRAAGGRLTPRGFSVPAQVRGAFVPAAVATFAGFAVLGLFTAVAPTFLAEILDIHNHAVAGLVVAVMFGASALAQLLTRPVRTTRALTAGCSVLVAGMVLIVLALLDSSIVLLVLGAVTAGAGQGIGFSKGVHSVAQAAPEPRRAEITSTLFVVAYLAISVPVVGVGVATQLWGLRTAGVWFAVAVALLAAGAAWASWRVGRAAVPGPPDDAGDPATGKPTLPGAPVRLDPDHRPIREADLDAQL